MINRPSIQKSLVLSCPFFYSVVSSLSLLHPSSTTDHIGTPSHCHGSHQWSYTIPTSAHRNPLSHLLQPCGPQEHLELQPCLHTMAWTCKGRAGKIHTRQTLQ